MKSVRLPWLAIWLVLAAPGLAIRAGVPDESALEREGDLAYSERARGFTDTGRIDAERIRQALEDYAAAAEENPGDLGPRFKWMAAVWWNGEFAVAPAERRKIFGDMIDLAQAAVDEVDRRAGCDEACLEGPIEARARLLRGVDGAAEAHFWAAIAWGSWALNTSKMSAAAAGAPTRIRDHARLLLAVDEAFGDGAGMRILGRLYTSIPKIPLISAWADRKEGIALLRRAEARYPDEPRNALFLAEALLAHAPRKHGEAQHLLREVASRKPEPSRIVEDNQTLERARELLEAGRP